MNNSTIGSEPRLASKSQSSLLKSFSNGNLIKSRPNIKSPIDDDPESTSNGGVARAYSKRKSNPIMFFLNVADEQPTLPRSLSKMKSESVGEISRSGTLNSKIKSLFAKNEANSSTASNESLKSKISNPLNFHHIVHLDDPHLHQPITLVRPSSSPPRNSSPELDSAPDVPMISVNLGSTKATLSALGQLFLGSKSESAKEDELVEVASSNTKPVKKGFTLKAKSRLANEQTKTIIEGKEEDVILSLPQRSFTKNARKKSVNPERKASILQLLFNKNSRMDRRVQLNNRLSSVSSVQERVIMTEEWMLSEAEATKRLTMNDFEVIKSLGHGGFGVVRLVRDKKTGDIFAMKTLKKQDMMDRKQELHVKVYRSIIKAERDLLCQASNVADWIVRLICTFQDESFLNFIMEYMPGGDLLGLLIKMDIFEEGFAKHYAAEMVMAVEEVHKLGMIHRDIKPDNFLFDSQGHIKLADFGLAAGFNWATSSVRFSVVGTTSYIAPEVFTGTGYDTSSDWWSLGVIIFECVYGYPPFNGATPMETKRKILDWPNNLHFPNNIKCSGDGKDFISGLICDQKNRMGAGVATRDALFEENTSNSLVKKMLSQGDAIDIKSHAWFTG